MATSIFDAVAAGLILTGKAARAISGDFAALSTAAADAESKVTSAMRRAQDEAKATAEALHGISAGGGLGDLASEIESSIGRP